jgi:hypothetical protein
VVVVRPKLELIVVQEVLLQERQVEMVQQLQFQEVLLLMLVEEVALVILLQVQVERSWWIRWWWRWWWNL